MYPHLLIPKHYSLILRTKQEVLGRPSKSWTGITSGASEDGGTFNQGNWIHPKTQSYTGHRLLSYHLVPKQLWFSTRPCLFVYG